MNSFFSTKSISLIYEGNDYDSKPAVAQLTLVVQEAHDLILLTETVARHRWYNKKRKCIQVLQFNLFVTFIVDVLNPYCEVTVGLLTLKTPFIKRTNNPKWNSTMEFLLYNLVEDIIHINIFDNEFSPDGLFYILAFLFRKHFLHFKKISAIHQCI